MNRPNRESRNQAMRWSCSAADSAAGEGVGIRDMKEATSTKSFRKFNRINSVMLTLEALHFRDSAAIPFLGASVSHRRSRSAAFRLQKRLNQSEFPHRVIHHAEQLTHRRFGFVAHV